MKFAYRAITASVAVALLSACSSAPKLSSTPASPSAPSAANSAAPAPMMSAPVAAPTAQSKTLPAYLDPSNPLSTKRSVFFDFDNYSIKSEFAQTLEMHGKFLSTNPNVSIRVEGNADERGSAEYNLALGQKRADAVARALKVFGVKESQLEVISFGREKPRALGHDEAAWSQNRRVDLDYPSK